MKLPNLRPALLGGCAVSVWAGAALADPPGRVGRVSAVEGEVSFLPPGEDDWTSATRNFPVAEGESFWTGDTGRTELQVGVMEIRLDSETELDVLALNYGQTRLSLPQGSVDLRLWRVPRGGVSVATPAGEVRFDRAGVYRLDVGASPDDGGYPPVELTVLEGQADAPGPDGFIPVEAGAAALVYAGYDPDIEYAQDASIDDWARAREARERWDSQAAFSPSLTGYEDLEGQGDFVESSDYGTVWYPRGVPDDWAPYRYGHWASVYPWGWTWIDDQPWGFAPFHYGRWVQVDGRWGWVPGQPTAEPVYAPALVAFIGGAAFGGGGAVGWIPLGPDEVYRPSYQVSPGYFRQVNVANVRQTTIENITINTVVNVTQYRNAPAATVVRSDAFARGGSVQRALAPISQASLMQARPMAAAAMPAPTAQAKTGAAFGGGSPGAGRAPSAPPPARLQAIRTAVAAQAPGSSRPPVIAGARIAPPRPKPAGAPAFIAPAQVRNPAAQAGQPVAPPARAPAGMSGPAPRGPAPAMTREPPQPTQGEPMAREPMTSPPIAARRPVPTPAVEAPTPSRPAVPGAPRPGRPPPPEEPLGARPLAPSRPSPPIDEAGRPLTPPAAAARPAAPAARPASPPAQAKPAKAPDDESKKRDRGDPDKRPPQ
jgi:hypothetical protein